MTVPQWAANAFFGLAIGLATLGLVYGVLKLIGGELHHFVSALKTEIKDAAMLKSTVGAWNAWGLLVVAAFGLVVMMIASSQKLLGLVLGSLIGEAKANELAKYSDFSNFFYCIFAFALVSLICVTIDKRDR